MTVAEDAATVRAQAARMRTQAFAALDQADALEARLDLIERLAGQEGELAKAQALLDDRRRLVTERAEAVAQAGRDVAYVRDRRATVSGEDIDTILFAEMLDKKIWYLADAERAAATAHDQAVRLREDAERTARRAQATVQATRARIDGDPLAEADTTGSTRWIMRNCWGLLAAHESGQRRLPATLRALAVAMAEAQYKGAGLATAAEERIVLRVQAAEEHARRTAFLTTSTTR